MDTNTRPTQCTRILQYLDDFGSITQREALADLGIMRLASRISELKRKGYTFEKTTEYGKNRYNEIIHYTRYRLVNKSA